MAEASQVSPSDLNGRQYELDDSIGRAQHSSTLQSDQDTQDFWVRAVSHQLGIILLATREGMATVPPRSIPTITTIAASEVHIFAILQDF